jgi:hypothetical protein
LVKAQLCPVSVAHLLDGLLVVECIVQQELFTLQSILIPFIVLDALSTTHKVLLVHSQNVFEVSLIPHVLTHAVVPLFALAYLPSVSQLVLFERL